MHRNRVLKQFLYSSGIDSPTITLLLEKGWVALHSVVREDEFFWEKISQLKEAGASGISLLLLIALFFNER